MNDIRSLGNASDSATYAPATLADALKLNASLSSIAGTLGLSDSANTAFATAAYRAIADGIVTAVVRNYKYGMTTALNSLHAVTSDAAAVDVAGDVVYSADTLAKLMGFSATTAVDVANKIGVANNDQSVANAPAQMAQAAGYAWVMQVGQAVIKMAASDAASGSVKTTAAQIATTLLANKSITQNQYNNLMTAGSANSDANGYTRNGSAAASIGAQNFVLQLYTAESSAITNAKNDYLADPGTTNTLTKNRATNVFENPGDPNATKTQYYMTDYTNTYAYLQSYDAAYKAMVAADTASHTAATTNAANAGNISTAKPAVPSDLASNVTQALINSTYLADTTTLSAFGPDTIASQAYQAVYMAEAQNANAAYQAGVKAAGALAVDPATGLLNINGIGDVSYTDPVTKQVYNSTSDTTAAYQKLNKATSVSGPVSGTAFTDGFNSATVKLTLHATSADSTFSSASGVPADSVVYSVKGTKVTIPAPIVTGWYATPGIATGIAGTDAFATNSTLTFTYVKGISLQTSTVTAASVPFTGAKASTIARPVVHLTWSDGQTQDVPLTDSSMYQFTPDGIAVGSYNFTVTAAGAQSILAALVSLSGYQLPTAASLTGLAGTFSITNNPAKQPSLVTKPVVYYVGNGQSPTAQSFVQSVTDATGQPGDASKVMSDLGSVGMDTTKDGSYTVKVTFADPVSGESVTQTANLKIVSNATSAAQSAASTSASAASQSAASQSAVSASAQSQSVVSASAASQSAISVSAASQSAESQSVVSASAQSQSAVSASAASQSAESQSIASASAQSQSVVSASATSQSAISASAASQSAESQSVVSASAQSQSVVSASAASQSAISASAASQSAESQSVASASAQSQSTVSASAASQSAESQSVVSASAQSESTVSASAASQSAISASAVSQSAESQSVVSASAQSQSTVSASAASQSAISASAASQSAESQSVVSASQASQSAESQSVVSASAQSQSTASASAASQSAASQSAASA
ncbi:hypothetical protein, partial [Schleiferilactobacillus harbinensis]|uniref:hypothetical protein n=1 Tax=Schleiferilactobacillus harbinensis TaxID=304207 RepID=UPI0039EC3E28